MLKKNVYHRIRILLKLDKYCILNRQLPAWWAQLSNNNYNASYKYDEHTLIIIIPYCTDNLPILSQNTSLFRIVFYVLFIILTIIKTETIIITTRTESYIANTFARTNISLNNVLHCSAPGPCSKLVIFFRLWRTENSAFVWTSPKSFGRDQDFCSEMFSFRQGRLKCKLRNVDRNASYYMFPATRV